jgi:hypothetical protein
MHLIVSRALSSPVQAGGVETMRITEANSISGAGMEDVSDKYAAALWQAGNVQGWSPAQWKLVWL